jgi:hypothetical protein
MSAALDLLAVHTSDAAGSIAVGRGGRIAAAEFEAAGKHAPVLLSAILDLLDTTGARLEDLRAVAVTTGPGSFTGIRVGLATVQGLAAARRWPVLPCDCWARPRWAADDGPLSFRFRRGRCTGSSTGAAGVEPRALFAPPVAAAERLASRARVDARSAAHGACGCRERRGALAGVDARGPGSARHPSPWRGRWSAWPGRGFCRRSSRRRSNPPT